MSGLAQFDAAEKHFREALAANQRMKTPPLVAYTRFEWAKMLVLRNAPGERAPARERV